MDNCCICDSPGGSFGCWNGNKFVWFCGEHQHLGQPVPPQNGRFEAPRRDKEYERFLKSGLTYSWKTKMVGFIRIMINEGELYNGETLRKLAERWIGPPPSPHTVGNAINEAVGLGLLEDAKEDLVAPRDKKSHGSKTRAWRKTAVK